MSILEHETHIEYLPTTMKMELPDYIEMASTSEIQVQNPDKNNDDDSYEHDDGLFEVMEMNHGKPEKQDVDDEMYQHQETIEESHEIDGTVEMSRFFNFDFQIFFFY